MGTGKDFRHHIAPTPILEIERLRSRREKLSKVTQQVSQTTEIRTQVSHNSAKLDQLL